MKTISMFLSFTLLVPAALTGCAADASSDAEASSALESTHAAPVGHWRLSNTAIGADHWIEELNIHQDGTYEAEIGDGASNLSGHRLYVSGTSRVDGTGQASKLLLGEDPFEFRMVDGALQVRATGRTEVQPWFSLTKQSAPVTITFAPDRSAKADTLVAGGTMLVRYAASRVRCNGMFEGFYMVDGRGPIALELDPSLVRVVNGYYNLLLPIPSGQKLEFWFHSTSDPFRAPGACDDYDKNTNGQNFAFSITPAR